MKQKFVLLRNNSNYLFSQKNVFTKKCIYILVSQYVNNTICIPIKIMPKTSLITQVFFEMFRIEKEIIRICLGVFFSKIILKLFLRKIFIEEKILMYKLANYSIR